MMNNWILRLVLFSLSFLLLCTSVVVQAQWEPEVRLTPEPVRAPAMNVAEPGGVWNGPSAGVSVVKAHDVALERVSLRGA